MEWKEHEEALTERLARIVGGGLAERASSRWWSPDTPQRWSGVFRGRPVAIDLIPNEGSGRHAIGQVDIHVSVEPLRSITLDLRCGHKAGSYSGVLPLATGDPRFEQRFTLWGRPAEVVLALLDEATRESLLQAFDGYLGRLALTAGQLSLQVSLVEESFREPSPLLALEAADPGGRLARWIELVTGLAERIPATYDRVEGEIKRLPDAEQRLARWRAPQVRGGKVMLLLLLIAAAVAGGMGLSVWLLMR